MSSLSLGDELGGYRLEQVAGRGGMGVVYRATQIRLDRVVALKVIAPELASDPLFRKRFQREARLMAAVDDPHVIPVYEAGEADGQLFLSMRWIEGGDLADEIARTGGLDPERAHNVLAQVAGALDAVHANGLVHGDMKPANVLLELRGGAEHAYLSDFGAGRLLENTATVSGATATGQWLGTVDYVAPETIRGAPPDARSDLYGFACVLFESLTGAPPFHRDTAWATMWAHDHDPPPSACERRPTLPRGVDAVLARGLAKDPDDRYPSGERLLQALGDVLMAGRGEATGPVLRPPGAPAEPSAVRLHRTTAPVAPVAAEAEDVEEAGRPPVRRAGVRVLRGRRGILGALAGVLLIAGAVVAGVIATSGSGSPRAKPAAQVAPATIASRAPLGAGTVAVRVAASGQNEYVLDQYGQYVDVLADGSPPPTRVSVPGKPQSLVLDPTHRTLWVGLLNNQLVAISLSGNRVTKTIPLPIRPDGLAVIGSDVIVQQGNPGALARVDAATGKVIGSPVTPGGSATAMVAYNGSVLVTLVFPPRLERFSSSLHSLADNTIQAALPTAMALDSLGTLWVADYDDARVYRLNPADGTSEGPALAVGQDPIELAVSQNYVWVANAGDETVSLIDEQSGSQPQAGVLRIGAAVGSLAGGGDGDAYMPSGTNLLMLQPKY